VRQAKRKKEEIKRYGTTIVIKTSDLVTETTSNAVGAVGALCHAADARLKHGEEPSKRESLDHPSNDLREESASAVSREQNDTPNPNRVSRDAHDYQDEHEMKNNVKWKYVAARIDDVARFWIPISYVVALAIIFAKVWPW